MDRTAPPQHLAGLIGLIREKSYREGDFTLASGKKSKFYIDLKPTTLSSEGAFLIGELVVELILREGLEVEAVGGMTLGADPLATAVSLATRGRFGSGESFGLPAYIVRKEPKDHGTARFIEGVENLRSGAKLLVLEDVVTTGGSSLKAIERLREAGYEPTTVLTIVDREQGGREAFEKAGVRFFSLIKISQLKTQ